MTFIENNIRITWTSFVQGRFKNEASEVELFLSLPNRPCDLGTTGLKEVTGRYPILKY